MIKRVIVTDLDGTLLDEHERIHPADIALLKNLPDDVVFIPASGRALASIKHVFNSNHCDLPEPFPYPVISLNGAMGFARGEELAFYQHLPAQLVADVLKLTSSYSKICFLFLDRKNAFMVNPTQFGLLGELRYHFMSTPFEPGIDLINIAKIMCLSDDRKALQDFDRTTRDFECSHAFSMDTILELTPVGVNKGSALKKLIRSFGQVSEFEILAAGDGGNDLEMLDLAAISFASDQSPANVRAHADVIYPYGSNLLELMINSRI